MNWDDPIQRARLIERVGSERYNELFAAYREASVVARVAGYAIRPVQTRFGRIFVLDGGDAIGFASLEEALAFARGNPIEGGPR